MCRSQEGSGRWTLSSILVGCVVLVEAWPICAVSLSALAAWHILQVPEDASLLDQANSRGTVSWKVREVGQLIATKIYPKDEQMALLLGKLYLFGRGVCALDFLLPFTALEH